MRKKKTHVEFIEEMKIINSNIEFLDEYKSAKEKISCKCKIDGYEWFATPSNLLRGKGCPKCGGTLKKTHDEFVETIKSLKTCCGVENHNIGIIVISDGTVIGNVVDVSGNALKLA